MIPVACSTNYFRSGIIKIKRKQSKFLNFIFFQSSNWFAEVVKNDYKNLGGKAQAHKARRCKNPIGRDITGALMRPQNSHRRTALFSNTLWFSILRRTKPRHPKGEERERESMATSKLQALWNHPAGPKTSNLLFSLHKYRKIISQFHPSYFFDFPHFRFVELNFLDFPVFLLVLLIL